MIINFSSWYIPFYIDCVIRNFGIAKVRAPRD
jgi:hypothetical protein